MGNETLERMKAETEEMRRSNKKRLIEIVENNFEEINSLISKAQYLDDLRLSDLIIKYCCHNIEIAYTLAQLHLIDPTDSDELSSYREKYDQIKERINSYFEDRNQEA